MARVVAGAYISPCAERNRLSRRRAMASQVAELGQSVTWCSVDKNVHLTQPLLAFMQQQLFESWQLLISVARCAVNTILSEKAREETLMLRHAQ